MFVFTFNLVWRLIIIFINKTVLKNPTLKDVALIHEPLSPVRYSTVQLNIGTSFLGSSDGALSTFKSRMLQENSPRSSFEVALEFSFYERRRMCVHFSHTAQELWSICSSHTVASRRIRFFFPFLPISFFFFV